MNNRLEIQIGNKKLVAEIYDWYGELPNELCVFIEDEDGNITQDICFVRGHYSYNKETNKNEFDQNSIDCFVFADSYNEDFTDKFHIEVYEDEDD